VEPYRLEFFGIHVDSDHSMNQLWQQAKMSHILMGCTPAACVEGTTAAFWPGRLARGTVT
jgi:hypothetical protein